MRRIASVALLTAAAVAAAWAWSERDRILNPVDRGLTADDVTIDFWYGSEQRFGARGRPQPWLNVLGNVSPADQVDTLTFSIDGGPARPLALGSDLHRLTLAGDFNAEIGYDEVGAGDHEVRVRARMRNGIETERAVRVRVAPETTWPLPYAVDFAAVDDLQDVVQLVDGQWRLEADGVRTVQRGYDRVLTLGDTTWRDYEALVHLTVHDYTPPAPGPPTYEVTHFGVALRWRGHHDDGLQPRRKWFPLGAQGELLVRNHPDSSRWRILRDQAEDKPQLLQPGYGRVEVGRPLWIRTRVATLDDGSTRYRFRQWPDGAPEPASWDVEVREIGDYPSGALCLVPHNTDVTIHSVRVDPLGAEAIATPSEAPAGIPPPAAGG